VNRQAYYGGLIMSNKAVWMEYKAILEQYVVATEANTDHNLIKQLALALQALESSLVETAPHIERETIKINLYRPTSVVKAFESMCL